jgi:hypothetical protein
VFGAPKRDLKEEIDEELWGHGLRDDDEGGPQEVESEWSGKCYRTHVHPQPTMPANPPASRILAVRWGVRSAKEGLEGGD